MYLLDKTQVKTISGGVYSQTCYDIYQAVSENCAQQLLTPFPQIDNTIVIKNPDKHKYGFREVAIFLCGEDSFYETESVYCQNNPDKCLKTE